MNSRSPPPQRTIQIHPAAPPKPAWGEPCNGCGVCCLSEPCPVGQLLSRRKQGACVAVHWDEQRQGYACGMVTSPERWWPLPWRWTRQLATRISLRWIASGKGCDCDFELEEDGGSD